MDEKNLRAALIAQRTEATEASIYQTLARVSKNEDNARVLARIGKDEDTHAAFWKTKTGVDAEASRFTVVARVALARLFGLTFVLKQMERGENRASRGYGQLAACFPEAEIIGREEDEHEQQLLCMLNEKWLSYVGSIVLGLNDALVELTGALAGFALALSDSRVISLAGSVTGISAAMSMGASAYLSAKADGDKRASTAALYTGIAYVVTVGLLILPFLLLSNKFVSLGITVAVAVVIILAFNYYVSVVKELNFRRRFTEMAAISLGVAALSFLIGWALKALLGVSG
ncbi:MAG: VIT1/CCC1 family protein [Actinobacteria bacterium]|nr:VIT1/CCC1 family protein [Actinomycetota bacterium]